MREEKQQKAPKKISPGWKTSLWEIGTMNVETFKDFSFLLSDLKVFAL